MRKAIYAFLVILMLFSSGCSLFQGDKPSVTQNYHLTEDLAKSKEYVEKSTETLSNATKKIEADAVEIKRDSQDAQLLTDDPKMDPILENIEKKSEDIIDTTDELRRVESELAFALDKLKIAELSAIFNLT